METARSIKLRWIPTELALSFTRGLVPTPGTCSAALEPLIYTIIRFCGEKFYRLAAAPAAVSLWELEVNVSRHGSRPDPSGSGTEKWIPQPETSIGFRNLRSCQGR